MAEKKAGKPTFESQMTELEAVVERLERGELNLEESVRLFEEGVRLSTACKGELENAERRIQVLVEPKSGKTEELELGEED